MAVLRIEAQALAGQLEAVGQQIRVHALAAHARDEVAYVVLVFAQVVDRAGRGPDSGCETSYSAVQVYSTRHRRLLPPVFAGAVDATRDERHAADRCTERRRIVCGVGPRPCPTRR